MIKEKKGITLISLIVTIVIMLIIISATTYTSLNRLEVNKLKKMYTDIKLLNDKVSNYYLKYNGIPIKRDNDNSEIKYTLNLDFEKNQSDNNNYYILDLSAMEGISLNYGQDGYNNINISDDVYVINEKSHIIYYVKGIEIDGKTYHSLKQDEQISDNIPPTTPEIKVINGKLNEDESSYIGTVTLEFISGKDNGSGISQTTYSIDGGITYTNIANIANNILVITQTTNIILRTYDNSGRYSETTETIEISEVEESIQYSEWTQNGTTVTNGTTTLSVGTTIISSYLPTLAEGNSWKVLGAGNGQVLLMTASNINNNFTLDGSVGYDSKTNTYKGQEQALDAECINKVNITGTKATSVRCIRVEDINRVTGYNPQNQGNRIIYGTGQTYQYGNNITYSLNNNKVEYSSRVQSGISNYTTFRLPDGRVMGITEGFDIFTIISDFYYYYPYRLSQDSGTSGVQIGLATTDPAYILLFKQVDGITNDNYLLASSYIKALDGIIGLGIRCVTNGNVKEKSLHNSSLSSSYTASSGVRAVISVASDFQF